jgi:hypothetical protein
MNPLKVIVRLDDTANMSEYRQLLLLAFGYKLAPSLDISQLLSNISRVINNEFP